MTNLHFRRLIDNGIHELLYKGYCIKSLIIQRGSMDCIITRTGYPKIERQAGPQVAVPAAADSFEAWAVDVGRILGSMATFFSYLIGFRPLLL